MWVKICGNTRLEDCLAAADAGADAVGFVFASGKRTVTASQVAAITAKLPASLEKIGVFTSREAKEIAETANAAGLTGVQLHGPLDVALLEGLLKSDFKGKLIQVLHWRTDIKSEPQRESFALQVALVGDLGFVGSILIDSQTASASGGTGKAFDWTAVAPLITASQVPVIVAGGLRPETVQAAVATLRPWGVDVSSGVEDSPGAKNADRIREFIRNARSL